MILNQNRSSIRIIQHWKLEAHGVFYQSIFLVFPYFSYLHTHRIHQNHGLLRLRCAFCSSTEGPSNDSSCGMDKAWGWATTKTTSELTWAQHGNWSQHAQIEVNHDNSYWNHKIGDPSCFFWGALNEYSPNSVPTVWVLQKRGKDTVSHLCQQIPILFSKWSPSAAVKTIYQRMLSQKKSSSPASIFQGQDCFGESSMRTILIKLFRLYISVYLCIRWELSFHLRVKLPLLLFSLSGNDGRHMLSMPLPRALLDMAGSLCSIPTAATWWSDGGTFWWHLQCCLRMAWDAINTPKCHVLGHTVELETSCTNKVNYSKPNEKWYYENTSSQLDADKVDHGEPKTDVTHTTGYASLKSAWVPPWYQSILKLTSAIQANTLHLWWPASSSLATSFLKYCYCYSLELPQVHSSPFPRITLRITRKFP